MDLLNNLGQVPATPQISLFDIGSGFYIPSVIQGSLSHNIGFLGKLSDGSMVIWDGSIKNVFIYSSASLLESFQNLPVYPKQYFELLINDCLATSSNRQIAAFYAFFNSKDVSSYIIFRQAQVNTNLTGNVRPIFKREFSVKVSSIFNFSVVASISNSILVVADSSSNIWVFNTASRTEEPIKTFSSSVTGGSVSLLTLAKTGAFAYADKSNNIQLYYSYAKNGSKPGRSIQTVIGGVQILAFQEDNSLASVEVASDTNVLLIYNPMTGACTKSFRFPTLYSNNSNFDPSVIATSASFLIALGSFDGSILIWNTSLPSGSLPIVTIPSRYQNQGFNPGLVFLNNRTLVSIP